MIVNYILMSIIIFIVIIYIYYYFKKNENKQVTYTFNEDYYDIDNLLNYVKNKFNEILKLNLYEMNLSKVEFDKKMRNRALLRKALKNCSYGDMQSKNYVKSYIRDILINSYGINNTNINKVINFDYPKELSIQDKFEIILLRYKQKYRNDALTQMIEEYKLDEPKKNEDGYSYIITKEEIEKIYREKVGRLIKFEEKLEIIVQRIYQEYKGYGVIDEIRDMNIDGVSGGVSGLADTFDYKINEINKHLKLPYNYDAVWIFYKGKTIHLSFLTFGSERELIRVCKNIYRYNNPGQLSESNGYKVNEMKDGSRVVVARPPFSESWVFFVRKFDSIKKAKTEDLITDDNNKLPIELMKWLIKGCRVIAITGSQGTGKTTLLMSLIKYINPMFTLRIQEMSFELQLRKIYPYRNIVTFRETKDISGQEGLDLQKKTDGTVNILGEVATAEVSSWMIQMSQVASLFTIFTHHAKSTENLIFSIRNNLLQTGVFTNEKVAEQQVVDVINFDIHLTKSIDGHRYIERITEIIPLSQFSEYPKKYKQAKGYEEKIDAFMETLEEFFYRSTDRKTFIAKDIVRYENGKYVPCNKISDSTKNKILENLLTEEKISFNKFLESNWGGEVSGN